jgi:hypothetical protein
MTIALMPRNVRPPRATPPGAQIVLKELDGFFYRIELSFGGTVVSVVVAKRALKARPIS